MEVNLSMIHKEFGLRLRKIRLSRKLTQKDISNQLNISRQAYSNYEQGRCLPPPNTLADLSILLNTNLFILFIQDAVNQRNFKPLNQDCTITEDELNSLLDLYSQMPLESRNKLLEHMHIPDYGK